VTSYLAQSADVINDSIRLERQMDWMLFGNEQNTRLWSGEDWVPGDPMFPDPRRPLGCGCDECAEMLRSVGQNVRLFNHAIEYPAEYTGNTPRSMIDLFDDGDRYPAIRCEPCGVSWRGLEACWVCGKERPTLLARMPSGSAASWTADEPRMAQVVDVAEVPGGGLSYQMRFMDDFTVISAEAAATMDRIMAEMWAAMNQEMRLFTRRVQAIDMSMFSLGQNPPISIPGVRPAIVEPEAVTATDDEILIPQSRINEIVAQPWEIPMPEPRELNLFDDYNTPWTTPINQQRRNRD